MKWNSRSIEKTRNILKNLSYSNREDKIFFKNYDGRFGYIGNNDFLNNNLIILIDEEKIRYESIEDLISDNWILD